LFGLGEFTLWHTGNMLRSYYCRIWCVENLDEFGGWICLYSYVDEWNIKSDRCKELFKALILLLRQRDFEMKRTHFRESLFVYLVTFPRRKEA